MESNREINIKDFRLIINMIFDHINEDLKIEVCPLADNYCWEISGDSLYAVDKNVDSPSVGSLQDDLEFLNSLLAKDRSQAVSLMFIHAAPLLRYLGQKIRQ